MAEQEDGVRRVYWAGLSAGVGALLAGRLLKPTLHHFARHDATATNNVPDDLELLDKAVEYSRERERLALVSIGLGLSVNAATVFSGAPAKVFRWVSRWAPASARGSAFTLTWSAIEQAWSLPFAYYAGHVVERKYGLANQTSRGWLGDQAKGFALGAAINLPLTAGFTYVVRRWPRRWWLIVSVAALPVTSLIAGLYPVLIAPIFNRFEPLDDPDLDGRIRALAEREGVCISQVMRMDMSKQTSKANAFFAGIGGTKRIVLADTLLKSFSTEEIEAVVAHELAHQVHRDTWRLVGLAGVGTFGFTYSLNRLLPVVLRRTRGRTGVHSLADSHSMPLVSLLASVFGLATMPLLNAYVRSTERAADRYALRATGNPDGFIGAMRQLQRTNLADPDPPAIVRILMHSHPTIGERIRWAESKKQP